MFLLFLLTVPTLILQSQERVLNKNQVRSNFCTSDPEVLVPNETDIRVISASVKNSN